MNLLFSPQAWKDDLYWQQNDRRMVKKIHGMIKEITRHPYEGSGKPEALKYALSGFWSRRISSEHRMVYQVVEGTIRIVQLRYHYGE